jgi:hypothetical protein
MFLGGFGHTYGHQRIYGFRPSWKTDLSAEGRGQMRVLRALMESKPAEGRIVDQSLIVREQNPKNENRDFIAATRDKNGEWAFIYIPWGQQTPVNMAALGNGAYDAYWFDPRNGMWRVDGEESERKTPFKKSVSGGKGAAVSVFDPPCGHVGGNDWVLVLEA